MTSTVLVRSTNPDRFGNHVRNVKPPMLLSGAEQSLQDRETELVDNTIHRWSAQKLAGEIEGRDPSYVVMKFASPDRAFVEKLTDHLTDDVTLIGTGQHPAYAPNTLSELGFDYGIRGEYDIVLSELLDTIEGSGEIPSSAYDCEIGYTPDEIARTPIEEASPPDVSLVTSSVYQDSYPVPGQSNPNWGYVMATRGCPHSCSFCSFSIRHSFGKGYRMHEPDEVVERMKELVDNGATVIDFLDDDLAISESYLKRLSEKIIESDLEVPWTAHARADEINDDLAALLKEAGCYLLRVGVESGSPRIIENLDKTPYPDRWNEQVRDAFQACRDVGIQTLALLMIGSPEETKDEVQKTWELVKEVDPALIQVHFFTPFPGTKYAEETGSTEEGAKYHTDGSTYSDMSARELKQMRRRMYMSFYINPKRAGKLFSNFGRGVYPLIRSTAVQRLRG